MTIEEPPPVDEVDEELTAPQAPGDPGYEAPAIIPELDLQGGTVFKLGEDEYASMSEAVEAQTDLNDQHTEAVAPPEGATLPGGPPEE